MRSRLLACAPRTLAALALAALVGACSAAPPMPDPPPTHPASPDAPASPEPQARRTLMHEPVSARVRRPAADEAPDRARPTGGMHGGMPGHGGKR